MTPRIKILLIGLLVFVAPAAWASYHVDSVPLDGSVSELISSLTENSRHVKKFPKHPMLGQMIRFGDDNGPKIFMAYTRPRGWVTLGFVTAKGRVVTEKGEK